MSLCWAHLITNTLEIPCVQSVSDEVFESCRILAAEATWFSRGSEYFLRMAARSDEVPVSIDLVLWASVTRGSPGHLIL